MCFIQRTMNANIINVTGFFKVIFILFVVFDLSVFGERLLWQNEAEINAEPILRHYNHHKNKQRHNEDVTEGYSKLKTNLRHRSHHHRNNHHTTTTTTTTTTTSLPPTTTTTIKTRTPEEHRLRHSNKFYQTFNLNHDYNREKSNVRRYINQSSYPTTTPNNPWKKLVSSSSFNNKPHHVKQSQSARNFYNVSKLMQYRLFDRDGVFYTTRPPKLRHPYDVLKVPYRDRVRIKPVKKSFEHNGLWDDSRFMEDDNDDVDWISNKRHLKLKSNNRNCKKLRDDYYEEDYYDDEEEDDDVDEKNLERESNLKDSDDIYSKSYIPGTLTKHKYDTLGTHDAVKESRQNYLSNQKKEQALAAGHAQRIHSEAMCRWPKPKIIAVQNDPAKLYTPHCTILHRCGDEAGCCFTDARMCAVKSSQTVDLYFYVKPMHQKKGTIEKRTFINHTECHCIDKASYTQSSPPEPMRRATVISCTCTKSFEQVLQEDGTCRCDCSSSNYACDWKKKGREHFSMEDRKCILEGRCTVPTCEYGSYDRRHGHCPKKEDKLNVGFSYHS